MNETRIMLWILAQLKTRYPTALWRRQNVIVAKVGGRHVKAGTTGSADLIGCVKGRYFEIEIKVPGKKQSAAQIEYEKLVKLAGGVYAVVTNPTEAFAVVDAL